MFFITYLHATTIVYNLRVAQITRQQISTGKPSLLLTTLFLQWRKFRDLLKQSDQGMLLTYIRSGQSWFAKMDVAGAHVRNKEGCTVLTRNQFDDIFLSAGYAIDPTKQLRISFSGHVGIPTHRDTLFDRIQFGTGHYAIAPQLDIAYIYSKRRPQHHLFGVTRLLHFFPRSARNDNHIPFPCTYTFAPGSIFSVLFAHQSNWQQRHRIEMGYDGTLGGIGSYICPHIPDFNGIKRFFSNSFYVSYMRRIAAFNQPSALLCTLVYGRDAFPDRFGLEYALSLFFTWAINF